jgi:polyribonucleotide nucleotidyltransferase
VHISKLGRGKRIDRVEDVLNLGDELEVRVDDIDQQGKVSLSIVGDAPEGGGGGGGGDRAPRAPREDDGGAPAAASASFEEFLDQEIGDSLGDLGPAEQGAPRSESRGGDRGPRRNPRRR